MGIYESHRRDGARVALPLPQRTHPLERWLHDEGRPLPQHPTPTRGGGIPDVASPAAAPGDNMFPPPSQRGRAREGASCAAGSDRRRIR